jgi:hypothetical protein
MAIVQKKEKPGVLFYSSIQVSDTDAADVWFIRGVFFLARSPNCITVHQYGLFWLFVPFGYKEQLLELQNLYRFMHCHSLNYIAALALFSKPLQTWRLCVQL